MFFRYIKIFSYGWAKSEAYLEPSGISKMELFMKIINN